MSIERRPILNPGRIEKYLPEGEKDPFLKLQYNLNGIPGYLSEPENFQRLILLLEQFDKFPIIRGIENLKTVDRELEKGASVLVVSNHKNLLVIFYLSTIARMLIHSDKVGIFVASKFEDGGMGKDWGRLIPLGIEEMGFEHLKIHREKDGYTQEQCSVLNRPAIENGLAILDSPSGVLEYCPEGQRANPMIEAKSGLATFSDRADITFPVTINSLGPTCSMQFHKPFNGKLFLKTLQRSYGRKTAKQVLEDCAMLAIASELKPRERGFYQEPFEVVSSVIKNIDQDLPIDKTQIEERWLRVARELVN